MLAKTARVTTADDYRAAVRRGARFVAPNTVTYVRRPGGATARFGFIVSKAVGVAVTRNLVRRRLKAVCYALQAQVEPGAEIVIRALPGTAVLSYEALRAEVSRSFTKAAVLS
ncbi:ribonuclease P protein component [Subtercola boreus]|uniref:Ribonuclease P protein component n=1 Tax=Subtercola boreus TaxID=120213 RepID=A0A3E0WGQ8_9MICO|nr:ribonuclease P protein component [Subtercola boreus]RFA23442.1 ribonuclease P protein component [Subtercola boreus]RFA23835.1 ribonuclease P protein component [Subtercola boreus]RFA29536.1 ribonuclease P protein component [Subtercola boreus]